MKPTFTLLLFLFIQSFTVKAQVIQWNGLQSYRDTELDVIITFKGDNSNIGNQFSTRLQIESFTIFSLKYNGTVYNGNNTDLPFPFKLYRDVAATTQFTQNIPGASGEMNETQSVYSNFSVPFLYDHQRWDEMDQAEKEKVRESWRSQFPFQSRVQVTSIKGVGISQVVGKVKALVSKRESEKRQFDALVERYNNATTWPQFEQIVEIIDGYDWPGAYRQKTEEIKRNCLAKIAELKNKEHDTKSSLTVESSHSPTPSNENHGNSDGNTSNSSASAQHASNGGTSMEDGNQSYTNNSGTVYHQEPIGQDEQQRQQDYIRQLQQNADVIRARNEQLTEIGISFIRLIEQANSSTNGSSTTHYELANLARGTVVELSKDIHTTSPEVIKRRIKEFEDLGLVAYTNVDSEWARCRYYFVKAANVLHTESNYYKNFQVDSGFIKGFKLINQIQLLEKKKYKDQVTYSIAGKNYDVASQYVKLANSSYKNGDNRQSEAYLKKAIIRITESILVFHHYPPFRKKLTELLNSSALYEKEFTKIADSSPLKESVLAYRAFYKIHQYSLYDKKNAWAQRQIHKAIDDYFSHSSDLLASKLIINAYEALSMSFSYENPMSLAALIDEFRSRSTHSNEAQQTDYEKLIILNQALEAYRSNNLNVISICVDEAKASAQKYVDFNDQPNFPIPIENFIKLEADSPKKERLITLLVHLGYEMENIAPGA